MAFRKADLQAIGGFDPQFRVAGDDVDVCWRLQQNGRSLGLNPAATVWHHRRDTVRTYWKQQVGYGRAEGQLRQKWPQKHNTLGHWLWRGQIYGTGITRAIPVRNGKVFHGTWGSAPFQSLYNPSPGTLLSLSLMPEWYLLVLFLTFLTVLGFLWQPLLLLTPLLLLALALPIAQAVISARGATFQSQPSSRFESFKMRGLTAMLHLFQPMARLWGRVHSTLTSTRQKRKAGFAVPRIHNSIFWSENWKAPEQRLETVEGALKAQGAVVSRGGDFDRWDLEVQNGMTSSVRTLMAVEEHGSGRQLIRFRSWPRIDPLSLILVLTFSLLAVLAAIDQVWIVTFILGAVALFLALRILWDCSTAMASLLKALERGGAAGGA
jgi:hypothetical protein